MSKKYLGHCFCGAVTYSFDHEPSFIANCHCTDCKRAAGAEMSTFAAVQESDFTVTGRTASFTYPRDSETCAGNGLDRVFCVICGSRVYRNKLADFQGTVFVEQGTLDRLDEWFVPHVEIFTWSRPPWMPALPVPQFDHWATREAEDDDTAKR